MTHPLNVNSHFKTTQSRNMSYCRRQRKRFTKYHAEFRLFTEKVILKSSKHLKVFNLNVNIGDNIRITKYCFFNYHTTVHANMHTHTLLKES